MREIDMYESILGDNPSQVQCEKIIGYAKKDIELQKIRIKHLELIINKAKEEYDIIQNTKDKLNKKP